MRRNIDLISDESFSHLTETHYDVAVFASGSNPRCTYIARHLERERINCCVILGFDNELQDAQRQQNDEYYLGYWSHTQIALGPDDVAPIYESLEQLKVNAQGTLRVLVDYSSMSRMWYAGILNWARYASWPKDIEIDFVYAVGSYKKEFLPFVIGDVVAIPGCEASPVSYPSSVAVFGLGFDGLAALCILDILEPNVVYAYLSEPTAFEEYVTTAREHNKELIEQHAVATISLPLARVETTFRYLTELISTHRSKAGITLVPMGPKPHVLAAILVGMRFEDVQCLHVGGRRQSTERVGPTGAVVATRVRLKLQQ